MGIDFEKHTFHTNYSMQRAFAVVHGRDLSERGVSFGGFGTKSNVRVFRDGLFTVAEAENIATQAMMDGLVTEDDPAMALALATEHPAAVRDAEKHPFITMTMTYDEWRASKDDPEVLRRIAARSLDVPLDHVASAESVTPYAAVSGWDTDESSARNDDLVTRYELVRSASRHSETTVGRYDSLDEARAALRSYNPDVTVYDAEPTTTQRMEIRAVLVHENGDAMIQATKTATTVEVPVRAVVGTVEAPASVDRSERSGWLFFGACPA